MISWFNCSTRRADSTPPPATICCLFSLFGLLSRLIASTGTSCMIALWVQEGTLEIGIRMTLGAAPGPILAGMVR